MSSNINRKSPLLDLHFNAESFGIVNDPNSSEEAKRHAKEELDKLGEVY